MLDGISSLRDIRHVNKVFFLGASELFYEPNYLHYRPSDELRSLVESITSGSGTEWCLRQIDVWTHAMPLMTNGHSKVLLKQGWKIHVSATNISCTTVLRIVASLMVQRNVQFKFANDIETLRLMTSKRWPRGGSGKFITIYPGSDGEFAELIELLHIRLRSHKGSYILSDRRYKDSRCVYYRYGGITPSSTLDILGRRLETLESPDGGTVVDRRNPYFELPVWVSDPFGHDDAEDGEATLNNGRFSVESALSFSNTGGVYLAHDNSTGNRVVIKEARPGVELSSSGKDAVDRLMHEAMILRLIEPTGVSPKVITTFQDWENSYLVETLIDGTDMRRIMLDGTPLLKVRPDNDSAYRFFSSCKSIFSSLLKAVMAIHANGVAIGDLSPTNVMVDVSSMTVKIIDLEGAFLPSLEEPIDIYTAGFRSNLKARAKADPYFEDLYAVGVIMMYSMFPIAAMAYIRADLFTTVLPVLVHDIGWGETSIQAVILGLVNGTFGAKEALDTLESSASPAIADHPAFIKAMNREDEDICAGISEFIVNNVRLDSAFSLFPIDPFGIQSNALGLHFGATGIALALSKVGIELPNDASQRYRAELSEATSRDLPPGLLIGSAGMGLGLIEQNDLELGCCFIDKANASSLASQHHSLFYGLAGIGMANLAAFLKTRVTKYLDRAVEQAVVLKSIARSNERGVYWEDGGGVRLGYGYGQSGVALFLLRLSQTLGEPEWRDFGRSALDFDLSYSTEIEPGIISFEGELKESHTMLPYIEQGSGGIAKVAIRYGLWDKVEGMLQDSNRKYSAFPGLIYGLTGFIDVLTDAAIYSSDAKYWQMAERPRSGLNDLYLFQTRHGLAAPGENLFRISCDYATGLAGVLYTVHRHRRRIFDMLTLDVLDDMKVE